MRIKPEQLLQHLQKNIAPLYTLFGNEPFLIIEACDLIRAHIQQQGHHERKILLVDQHFNWSDLQHISNSLSLFDERQIIDIRIPSGKPGREGSKALENHCQALPPDTVTLITLPQIDKSSQSTKWFKALEQTGLMLAFYPVERAQLPRWIQHRLDQQQQQTDTHTLQFFADKVEGNLLAAHQEIQKLGLLYPSGTLTFEQVKEAVLDVTHYDLYKLSDALVTTNIVRYTKILTGLREEGIAIPLIIAVLTEQIRTLITICKGIQLNQPVEQIMRNTRLWGDRQRIMLAAAKRTGLQPLTDMLAHAAKIDRINKGVAQGDAWNELSQLGLQFAFNPKYKRSGSLLDKST